MLKLLGRADSINVQKVMWCLEELGLEYERTDIGGKFGGNQEADYIAKNPTGLIPTLVDGNFTLWESHSIVRYLVDAYGKSPWLTDDPKARGVANQWMDWTLFTLWRPMVLSYIGLYRTPPEDRDNETINKALEQWSKHNQLLDNVLANSDYIAGNEISMGDLAVGPFVYRWLNMDIEHPKVSNLEKYYARLTERPAFKKHVMLPLT